MESSEVSLTSRRDDNPYIKSRHVAYSMKSRAETELSDARKTVKDLALKIEEANSRSKVIKQQKPEDFRYAQVEKEIENIKQELGNLKLDMARVKKEKRHAENIFKASASKKSTLSSAVERIKKEIEELDEEHVLVELARIEAVKEREAIEAQNKEETNRYQTQLEEVKKKVNEIDQRNELKRELQLTVYNVNSLENELTRAKETNMTPNNLSKHQTITEELQAAKTQLADVNREGFTFMASMDVIRNELEQVREQTARLQKAEAKRDVTVQTLNSQILEAKAKLESVTDTTDKANSIASNLSLTVEQLRAEAETATKEKDLVRKEIETMRVEIPKIESEIELSEEKLEAAIEELKTVKSSEFTALQKLKNMIDSTVRARELTNSTRSTITITKFEYEYLTGKACGAEEIADRKVDAARAWVEALKANENEILMKVETAEKEIRELEAEVEEQWCGTDRDSRRRTVDGDLNRWGHKEVKVVASPRRSMYKIASMTPGKRTRSQKLLSPATRQAIRSASFTKKREKATSNLAKLLDEKADVMGGD